MLRQLIQNIIEIILRLKSIKPCTNKVDIPILDVWQIMELSKSL